MRHEVVYAMHIQIIEAAVKLEEDMSGTRVLRIQFHMTRETARKWKNTPQTQVEHIYVEPRRPGCIN